MAPKTFSCNNDLSYFIMNKFTANKFMNKFMAKKSVFLSRATHTPTHS